MKLTLELNYSIADRQARMIDGVVRVQITLVCSLREENGNSVMRDKEEDGYAQKNTEPQRNSTGSKKNSEIHRLQGQYYVLFGIHWTLGQISLPVGLPAYQTRT